MNSDYSSPLSMLAQLYVKELSEEEHEILWPLLFCNDHLFPLHIFRSGSECRVRIVKKGIKSMEDKLVLKNLKEARAEYLVSQSHAEMVVCPEYISSIEQKFKPTPAGLILCIALTES